MFLYNSDIEKRSDYTLFPTFALYKTNIPGFILCKKKKNFMYFNILFLLLYIYFFSRSISL